MKFIPKLTFDFGSKIRPLSKASVTFFTSSCLIPSSKRRWESTLNTPNGTLFKDKTPSVKTDTAYVNLAICNIKLLETYL